MGAAVVATAETFEISAATDANGTFVLVVPDPPPFSLRLRVTAAGYEPLDLTIVDIPKTLELSLQAGRAPSARRC